MVPAGVHHLHPDALLLRPATGVPHLPRRTLRLSARAPRELLCPPPPGMAWRTERRKPGTGPRTDDHPAPETCIGRQPRVPLRTGRQTGTTRAAQPTARQRQRPGIPVRTGRKARQHHIAAHTPREHDNARGTSTGNAAATPPHGQRATRHQQTDAKQLHPPQLHTGHRKANTAPEHKDHIAPATSGDEQAKREKAIGHARSSQADIRTSAKAQLRTEMNKI